MVVRLLPIRFKPDFETPIGEKGWVQTVHLRSEEIDLCAYADNVDYLLLWGTPNEEKVADKIIRCYTLIEIEGGLKLYKESENCSMPIPCRQ